MSISDFVKEISTSGSEHENEDQGESKDHGTDQAPEDSPTDEDPL
jgi:hypothetical protein